MGDFSLQALILGEKSEMDIGVWETPVPGHHLIIRSVGQSWVLGTRGLSPEPGLCNMT